MKNFYISLFLAAGTISYCAGQSRDENIKEFLGYLKANDQQKIYDIGYHVRRTNSIMDSSLRRQYVAMAAEALNKYVVSPESKWIIENLQNGASVIHIGLISPSDSTPQASINLFFPPAAVSDKVYSFMVILKGDGKIVAPLRTNRN